MKNTLENWKKEIVEVSNGVWKITLTHKLGARVERVGFNMDLLEKEARVEAVRISKQSKNYD